MGNIIGITKKHPNDYEYLSLFDFPSNKLKEPISDSLVKKSN